MSAGDVAFNRAALERAVVNLRGVLESAQQGASGSWSRVGVQLTNLVKRELSQPGRGRTYRLGGVVHKASAPGDPPAIDTGRLRASIAWKADEQAGEVLVGTDVEYAPFLEFGTSRGAPRPFLAPVVEHNADVLRATVVSGVVSAETGAIRARRGGL